MVYSDPLVHLSETDSYVKQKINLLMIGGDICNMKIYLVSKSLISSNYYPFKSAFIIMNKGKQYDILLVKVGKINEELHFGAFGRFWWQSRDNILYPICLKIKILVIPNKTNFINTVVKG